MRPRPPRVRFRLNYSRSGPGCQHAILGRARVSTTWLASHPLICPRTSSARTPRREILWDSLGLPIDKVVSRR